jgi:nicotinamidase-related amidase
MTYALPPHTGLVLVDPYNDFLGDEGKIWPRLREIGEQVQVREHLGQLVQATRAAGLPVVIAPHRQYRSGDYENWANPAPSHIRLRDGRVFEQGTYGGEFHPVIDHQPTDRVAAQHWGLNGFANTDLDLLLRQAGVEHIVFAGVTAIGCLHGTARGAIELGYTLTLVRDATAAFAPDQMHAAHEVSGPYFAYAIVDTADVVAALKG